MISKETLYEKHAQGFNCAQCVVSAFAERTGVEEQVLLAAAGGFGGGVRCGEICGAASGAVMALGLMNPHTSPDAPEEKARISALTAEFIRRFRDAHGALTCRDLKGKCGVPCDELICSAAGLLDRMLEENQ